MDKYCLNCNKKLILKNKRDITRKKFCSRKCQTQLIKPHKGHKHSDETKQNLSRIRKLLKLSEGERNPRYIDGRRMFRKNLLNSKIPPKCLYCNSTSNLIAHHIKPCERTNTKGRNPLAGDHSVDNAIWVCPPCHKKYHLAT